MDRLLQEGIESGVFSRAACAWSDGGKRTEWFAGDADAHTSFDLASLTKPIATASTLLCLCEEGRLALRDPVASWLPEAPHLRDVTIFHLATHTSGLPAWRELTTIEGAVRTPLQRLPGLGYCYSDIGYILLGLILERAGGQSLDALAGELFFTPLAMAGTRFSAEVHDANAQALGGVAGHAGLTAPLADVAQFAESLLPGGKAPLSRRGGRDALVTNRIAGIGFQSVGMFTVGNDLLPDGGLFGEEAVGHTGFTGTVLILNPARGPAVVLLTDRVYHDPEGDRFRAFRRRFMGALAGWR